MVALHILEGEKIKREGRDLSILKTSERTTVNFVVYFKQNFKINLSNNFAFCYDGQHVS